jgi:hypothetical protein
MKTLFSKTFFILIAVLLISGCKKNIVINDKQAILFQVDYINYAWGYQHTGFIIDNEGNILTYNNPQNWIFPDKDLSLSESQVRSNLESCVKTGKKVSLQ